MQATFTARETVKNKSWRILLASVLLVIFIVVVLWLRMPTSQLAVDASHTTLRMGETEQLTVRKKTRLGTDAFAHPERAEYITSFESMAVVEPDGRVTAVGTWGKPQELARISVFRTVSLFDVCA